MDVHPNCSAMSSVSIADSASIGSTCVPAIAISRSRAGEEYEASATTCCAVPHGNPNRGPTENMMDEFCDTRVQNRPLRPPARHPHTGTPTPPYPVRTIRVDPDPCRYRAKTPWCGRALMRVKKNPIQIGRHI